MIDFIPLTEVSVDIDQSDLTMASFSYDGYSADFELDGCEGITPEYFNNLDKLGTDFDDLAVVRVDDLLEAQNITEDTRKAIEQILSRFVLVGSANERPYVADTQLVIDMILEQISK